MRLGVAAAVVDGEMVAGDVRVDTRSATVAEVGLSGGGGSGIACGGLVDLQVNGFAGVDFATGDVEEIRGALGALARSGVTAVAPTLHSLPVEGYLAALRRLGEARRTAVDGAAGIPRTVGARLLGAHLEGPFLAPARRGAHDVRHLLAPDEETLAGLLAAGEVSMVTLAPELDGAFELIASLRRRGVVVSLGHSDADAARARAAIDAGATHVTHLWNAQGALSARRPGLIGAALSDPRVVVGLIADRRHVSDEVIDVTLRCCPDRIAATSDAIADADTSPRPTPEAEPAGGELRGGLVAQDACLRNLVALGMDLPAALDACGGVQRALLGLAPARMRPGDPADVVVLDDALFPQRTLVAGRDVRGA